VATTWGYDCANAKGMLCSVNYGGSGGGTALAGQPGANQNATAKTTVYDKYSRPSQTVTVIAGQSFTSSIAYDGRGRPKYAVYPQATAQAKPLSLETLYDPNAGYATEVKHAETGLSYWKVDLRADDAQLVRGTLGGVISVNQTYSGDGLGRLARINISSGVGVAMPAVGTTGLLDQRFGFDSVGNLLNRTLNAPAGAGAARSESENFTYDFLDRFIGHTGSGVTDQGNGANTYDLAGNITSKAGMAMGYTAGSNRLCAITSITCGGGTGAISYDASGNITQYTRPNATQAPTVPGADGATLNLLNYTAFNLPLRITKSIGGAVQASGEFFYDAGYQRVRQIKRAGLIGSGAFVDDILYVVPGGFEVHRNEAGQVTSSIATISGPDGTVATVTTNFDVNTGQPLFVSAGAINTPSSISGVNTVTKLLLKDHLGSMVAEVTISGSVNAQGQVTAVSIVSNSLNVHGFGPWGNARNSASPLAEGQRGFTGHEHLAELGLIHMNGRIYDPVIGRFLQADPIIQAPHNAQSHNRYSYVMNNPLSLTDPSGFSWWTKHRRQVIGIVAGILTAGAATWAMGAYALANGATMFATAAGGLTKVGVIAAAAAGGFASGGINGGNIQSALRGAFMAGLTVGLLQGVSDAFSHITGPGTPDFGGISQGAQNYMAGGNSVVDAVNSTPGLSSQLQIPVSDAGSTTVLVDPVNLTGAKDASWFSRGLDWLANGPSDRNTIGGAVWMGMMASTGGRMGALARGASTASRGASTASAAERMAAIKQAGARGEDFLAKTYGGAQEVTKQTSLGARRIDTLADGVAMESKVGRTALTTRVEAQIAKDVELMATPGSGVNAVEWHFFQGKSGLGPTAPLLNKLLNCGITVCVHP
jgi:RHS repeat-associated protein